MGSTVAIRRAFARAAGLMTSSTPKRKTTPTRVSGRKRAKVDYREKGEADLTPAEDVVVVTAACGSSDVKRYRDLLVKHKKELYKDPPELPPHAEVLDKRGSEPKRDDRTGEYHFSDRKDFTPNLSPMEVLQQGGFGGTYFRSIDSAVTGLRYEGKQVLGELPAEWIKGLSIPKTLCSPNYDVKVNKYGVKCGGSLGMWESSGWITEIDPYGWFQWYCRFFQGRRSTDDDRQVGRWNKSAGLTGRFRGQLSNKVLAANTTHDNAAISPVIRQTLHHWGFELTKHALEEHKRRKGIR